MRIGDFIINSRNNNNLEDSNLDYMTDNTKNTIILGISVGAIVIALIAITMPLLNTPQVNNQHYSGQTREFWLFNSYIPVLMKQRWECRMMFTACLL
ncbi:MAG: hypothetical protein ACREA3_10525 [Nitrosotalea sp.]